MTEAGDSTDGGVELDAAVDAASDGEVSVATDSATMDSRATDSVTTDTGATGIGPGSRLGVSVAIAVTVALFDQISKRWALDALSDRRSRHVIWTLDWNLTFNSGMAFSRGQGIGPYIGAVALIVVVVMLLSLRRSGTRLSAIAVGLVVGGAVGNLSDRLFRGQGWLRGRVVDFIDFRWWPIFNVADMGVTIGGLLLLLAAVFESRSGPA